MIQIYYNDDDEGNAMMKKKKWESEEDLKLYLTQILFIGTSSSKRYNGFQNSIMMELDEDDKMT